VVPRDQGGRVTRTGAMSDNRYAPPAAKVADFIGTIPERPIEVTRAVQLCWLSIAIAMPAVADDFILGMEKGRGNYFAISFWVTNVIILAFATWVIVSIGRGRRWARIVYAVMTLASVVFMATSLTDEFLRPWYSWMASLLTTLLDMVIVVLLFLPLSNAWFRAMQAAR
jgi:hypothetical protein